MENNPLGSIKSFISNGANVSSAAKAGSDGNNKSDDAVAMVEASQSLLEEELPVPPLLEVAATRVDDNEREHFPELAIAAVVLLLEGAKAATGYG